MRMSYPYLILKKNRYIELFIILVSICFCFKTNLIIAQDQFHEHLVHYSSIEKAIGERIDSSAYAFYVQGLLLERENRFDEAITVYRKALQRDPLSAPISIKLGSIFFKQKKIAKAVNF